MHDDRVPQQLMDNLYPKYLALHKYQYLNTGAKLCPDSTKEFLSSTKDVSWKTFQKKEKVRLKSEN